MVSLPTHGQYMAVLSPAVSNNVTAKKIVCRVQVTGQPCKRDCQLLAAQQQQQEMVPVCCACKHSMLWTSLCCVTGLGWAVVGSRAIKPTASAVHSHACTNGVSSWSVETTGHAGTCSDHFCDMQDHWCRCMQPCSVCTVRQADHPRVRIAQLLCTGA